MSRKVTVELDTKDLTSRFKFRPLDAFVVTVEKSVMAFDFSECTEYDQKDIGNGVTRITIYDVPVGDNFDFDFIESIPCFRVEYFDGEMVTTGRLDVWHFTIRDSSCTVYQFPYKKEVDVTVSTADTVKNLLKNTWRRKS